MRYFIDTEFIESGPRWPIQLISIGIVCEDGREFYAVSNGYDPDTASEWVKKNVLSHVGKGRSSLDSIRRKIIEFVHPKFKSDPSMMSPRIVSEAMENPEFWGYYADYDWVVFCQIFGTMMDLPEGFPMYCRDIKQLCDDKGNPKLPEQGKGEHNALADARWNKAVWSFLTSQPPC